METFDKEGWLKGLTDYLKTMRERNPDFNHPGIDWMQLGFSHISFDFDQSDPAILFQDINIIVTNVVADKVGSPMADMRKKLDEHTKHHSVTEIISK